MTAIAMTLMIIMVGLVVDVGHAMLVQRQLQAGVDAAALAGAQHLPDAPTAESVADAVQRQPGQQERREHRRQRDHDARRSLASRACRAATGATAA